MHRLSADNDLQNIYTSILSADNKRLHIYTPFLSIDKYRHNVSFSPSPTVSKFADDAPLPSPTVGDMTPIEIRLQTGACPLSHP